MDKVIAYQNLIKEVLKCQVLHMDRYAQSDIETELSFDDEHGNYLLLSVGWTKTGRMLTPTIYIRLHNGKIWVENDWTEAGIVDQLLERGVLQEDLVLAFQPPELRVYTEFAPA